MVERNIRARHLFLTGEKQVGKSTILRKLLENRDDVGGFLTVRRCDDSGNMAVHMLRIDPKDDCCAENRLFICGESASAERFDTLGCEILASSRQCRILVMDELGRKERDSRKFQQAVLDLLDGEIPIYGVLQRADSAFLQRVAEHSAVQVVEVTKENRDELLKLLITEW